MGDFILEIAKNNIDLYVNDKKLIYYTKDLELLIFTFVFLTISFIIAIAQFYKYDWIFQIKKFNRIKRNMNNWKQIINEKTKIESTKGKTIALSNPDKDYTTLNCYDYGSYYIAGRLDNISYLPIMIRRGTGDVWKILKSGTVDKSAEQYCRYLIFTKSNNTITCGNDMYNKLGYGGYFNFGHPCQGFLNKLEL